MSKTNARIVKYDMTVDTVAGLAQMQRVGRKHEYKLWNAGGVGGMIMVQTNHVKLYNGHELSGRIESRDDYLKTHMLIEHVVRKTNRIGKPNKKGFADESDIAQILGIVEKRAREYLARMQKARVLAKIITETGGSVQISYAFNPVFVNSTKYVPLDLYVAFRDDIDEVIPGWMKDKYKEALEARGDNI